MRFALRLFVWMSILAVLVIELAGWGARHRQDLPWTPLDLSLPPGRFTAARLAALSDEPQACRALLGDAGSTSSAVPPRRDGASCGFADGVRLSSQNAADIRFAPAAPVTSCPVAAGIWLWQRDVVQPAATRFLKSPVVAIDHAGSYSCRRLYGRDDGAWSEHARANAFDVLGFRLANGQTVRVVRDWEGDGANARFLRAVRDGACTAFTTVLSPDYNAAHRDHLHLDMANRGTGGWTACR